MDNSRYRELARELNEPNNVRVLHNTAVILQEQYVQILFQNLSSFFLDE